MDADLQAEVTLSTAHQIVLVHANKLQIIVTRTDEGVVVDILDNEDEMIATTYAWFDEAENPVE